MHSSNEWLRSTYDRLAREYRKGDELHLESADHRRLCGRLQSICQEFTSPGSVLDLGCGTGRHFHCLRNVKHLVAMDISPEMLKQAEKPAKAEEVQVAKIEFFQEDMHSVSFPAESFDLIYALDVFGNGCGLTKSLSKKFYRWLKPSGHLFFNATDATKLPPLERVRRRLKWAVYHRLPKHLQSLWDKASGWPPFFYCSISSLMSTVQEAGFGYCTVEEVSCQLPKGIGFKFEGLARK